MTVIASGEIDLKLSAKSQAALENDLAKTGNAAGAKTGSEFSKGFESQVDKIKDKVGDALKKAGKAAGPAITAAGGLLTKLGQSQEKATINLRRAVENTGTSFKGFGRDLDGAIKQQAKFGTNSIDTTRALTTLTFKLKDPKKALDALALASDLAAAKNISLEAATGLVTKAYSGNVKVLGQFGINVKDSKTALADAAKAADAHRTAVEKLKTAQQNLSDLEAIQAGKKNLTIADEFRLRDAKQAVADAQANVASTADASIAAQGRAKGAIKGTEEAVGKLRGQVKGLAEEQSQTLEGRIKTLRVQIQNAATDLGQKFGPAVTAVGTATTIAANLAAFGLTPALLGVAGAYAAAALAGAGLGIVLHNFIEEHAPGVNRALEDVGAKLFDFGAKVTGNAEKVGLLADAQRIYNLTGEETSRKVDGQIKALSALAAQASGPTKASIQELINKLEDIDPTYRTEIDVNGVATAVYAVDNLRQLLDNVTKPRSVTVTVNTRAGNAAPLFPGGPTTANRPSNRQSLYPGSGSAAGGPGRNHWSWVGERGPEPMFLPLGSRVVSHASALEALRQGGGQGPTQENHFTIIDNTGDPEATARRVSTRIAQRSQR